MTDLQTSGYYLLGMECQSCSFEEEEAMSRNRIVVLLVATGVLVAIVWRGSIPKQFDSASPPSTEEESSTASARDRDLEGDPELARRGEESLPVEFPESEQAGDPPSVLSGRCLNAQTGSPLASCQVLLSMRDASRELIPATAPPPWQPLLSRSTDSDGRFEVAVPVVSGKEVKIRIRLEGFVPAHAILGSLRPDFTLELGELRLQPGCQIAGTVVDESDLAVANVRVSIEGVPLGLPAQAQDGTRLEGESDADGRFVIDGCVPEGVWSLQTPASGVLLQSPTRLLVRSGEEGQNLRLRVQRLPSLSGRVVDAIGQTVAGVKVMARMDHRGIWPFDISDDDGSFCIPAEDLRPVPVELFVRTAGPCEPYESRATYEWGQSDIELVVQRSRQVEVIVQEEETGQAVETFAVRYGPGAENRLPNRPRQEGKHTGGRLILDGIVTGQNSLQILPRDPLLLPSDPVTFESQDGGPMPLHVSLQKAVPLVVELVRADGSPVAGSRVQLVEPEEGVRFTLSSRAHDVVRTSASPDRAGPRILSESVSDASGRVTLGGPVEQSGLALRALGPGHPAAIRENVELRQDDDPLRWELPQGATLTGRVIPQQALALDLMLRLHEVAREGSVLPSETGGFTLRPNGSFHIPDLPAGEWQIKLSRRKYHDLGGGRRMAMLSEVSHYSSVVELRAGQTTEKMLEVLEIAPGTLLGRLVGVPLTAGTTVKLFHEGNRIGIHPVDDDGHFRAGPLPPGSYSLLVCIPADKPGNDHLLPYPGSFPVGPGEHLTHTFDFVLRKASARILQPDGVTAAARFELEVLVFEESGHLVGSRTVTTDEKGLLTLDPAPETLVILRVPRSGETIPWQPEPTVADEPVPELVLPESQSEN